MEHDGHGSRDFFTGSLVLSAHVNMRRPFARVLPFFEDKGRRKPRARVSELLDLVVVQPESRRNREEVVAENLPILTASRLRAFGKNRVERHRARVGVERRLFTGDKQSETAERLLVNEVLQDRHLEAGSGLELIRPFGLENGNVWLSDSTTTDKPARQLIAVD